MASVLAGEAVAGAGATQAEYLKIGLSARAAAMGGAFTAVADDLGALEHNPAGLGLLSNSQVSAMYSRWLADISFGALAGAHVVPLLGTVGLGVNLMDSGDIEGTARNFEASSFVLRAAWGRSVRRDLTLGVGAKIIRETIDEFSSSGGTLDGGLVYTPLRGLTFGLAALNIGAVSAFEEETGRLPYTFKGGMAVKVLEGEYGMIVTAADVDYVPGDPVKPSFGAEYWGGRYLALRVGYKVKDTDLSQLVGLAAGLGVRWESLRLDYAFAPFSSLGVTHRLTVNWEIWPLVRLSVPGSVVGELRTLPVGRLAPPAPPSLEAEPGERNVLLRWLAPEGSNIAGYNVYFKRVGDKAFRKFNLEPTTATSMIVGGLQTNARYYFVVRTVDDVNPPRESVPSPQATSIPY